MNKIIEDFLKQNVMQGDDKKSYRLNSRMFLQNHLQHSNAEAFHLRVEGSKIFIKTRDPLQGVKAGKFLQTKVSSKHLNEYYGLNRPLFSQRILFWEGSQVIDIGHGILLFFPRALIPLLDNLEDLSKNIALCLFELGFNTLCFGRLSDNKHLIKADSIEKIDLPSFFKHLHRWGIHVGIQAFQQDLSHKDKNINVFFEALRDNHELMENLNYLHLDLYKASYINANLTTLENIEAQIAILEQEIYPHFPLIRATYYLPHLENFHQELLGSWLEELDLNISHKTQLAFSANEGSPLSRRSNLHPILEVINAMNLSKNSLLPIINIGGINCGEGLWPSIEIEIVDNLINRMDKNHFAGCICLTRHLSKEPSILQANLWLLGHRLWQKTSAHNLLQTWFSLYSNPKGYMYFRQGLKTCESMLYDLVNLMEQSESAVLLHSIEYYRLKAESMLGQLNCLSSEYTDSEWISQMHKSDELFRDYFIFFIRDAKRIILYFLQKFKIPLANVLNGDDLKSSFWTSIGGVGSKRIAAGARVDILEEPNPGEKGSTQNKIYLINTTFS